MTSVAENPGSAADADAAAPAADTTRRWAIVIAAFVAIPMVLLIVRTIGQTWFPSGDDAILALRTGDVGTGSTPLLGPYSRYAWNHPGPLMFYLFAIPYRLVGAETWGMLTAVAAINALSVGAMLWLAWKRGQLLFLAILAAGLGVLIASLTPAVLEDPWNPSVTLLPFALFVVSTWAARMQTNVLPLNLFVGTFLIQAHIGFTVIVGALWLWMIFGVIRAGVTRRVLVVSAVVLALTWAPVVIDQIFGSHNITSLVKFFTTDHEHEPVGMKIALGISARELSGVAPWIGGPEPVVPEGIEGRSWAAIVPVAAFALAMFVARRRKNRPAFTFQVSVLIAAVSATLAVSRITDSATFYLVRFWWPLAMLWWASIVWSLASALKARWAQAAMVGGFALIGLGGGLFFAFTNTYVPTPRMQPGLDLVVPSTVDALRGADVVRLEGRGDIAGWVTDTMTAELERNGISVVAGSSQRFKLGEGRSDDTVDEQIVIVATNADARVTASDPSLRVIAHYDPVDPKPNPVTVRASSDGPPDTPIAVAIPR